MSARREPTHPMPFPPPRRNRPSRGFTLTEVLVTLAVVSVVLALIYQIFVSQQRSYSVQEEVADAQQNARVGVDELTRALTSLGAGVDTAHGQVRILVAHPYDIVFNADLNGAAGNVALPTGTALPAGWRTADDPYAAIPGSYSNVATELPPAETHRYYLEPEGEHYTLYHQMAYWDRTTNQPVWGAPQEVALLVANPALDDPSTPDLVEEPLFSYYGDFDGDGALDPQPLSRVDRATSARIASGDPPDAVIRRIGIEVATRTEHPDPRHPQDSGYRLTRLHTAVTPRNLWDCPSLSIVTGPPPGEQRVPDLLGQTQSVTFRVTVGGLPEPGRRVEFTLDGPPAASVTPAALTDAAGTATATVTWPPACGDLPPGTYHLTARTAAPPPLATPFGACAPDESRVSFTFVPGLPAQVLFNPPTGQPATVRFGSCGGTSTPPVAYEVLDGCQNLVRQQDMADNEVRLSVTPTGFARPTPDLLDQPAGSVELTSAATAFATLTSPPARSPTDPNAFLGGLEAYDRAGTILLGRADLEVGAAPARLVNLSSHIPGTTYTDCPSPALPVADTFGIEDACGNPLWTLQGTGAAVEARLDPDPGGASPPPDQGTLASPNNPSADPHLVSIERDNGDPANPGTFELRYQAPTCAVGGLTYRPQLTLSPSWAAPLAPLPLSLSPCITCSVQVHTATQSNVTLLDQACDGESEVVVNQCNPSGDTVQLVIEPGAASRGSPSFDRNAPRDTSVVTFTGPSERVPLYIGTAQTGDSFEVAAAIPDPATLAAPAGTSPVVCRSQAIDVSSRCSEILISPVADNPQAVPRNPQPSDTPLCAAEGSEVFFRVKDCDENRRSGAVDFIRNTAGTSKGLIVEVVDENGDVIDRESPDLEEVDIHGTRATDSPYFQGHLPVTQTDDPIHDFSGKLLAPRDRTVTLRALYQDPDDPLDIQCNAEAMLVPPLPVCLPFPVLSFGNWSGDLRVHGGDAAVAGDLLLPSPPTLIDKLESAPLLTTGLEDRFFNAYVGGAISVAGVPLSSHGTVDQPFTPSGGGAAVSTSDPNYFQNVPDTAGLLSRLDYDRLKLLARALGVYWEPQAGGTLFNPSTRLSGTFQEVTALPGGPGTSTPTHDGKFLFVDAPASLQSAAALDQAALADLPTYEVTGDYYTEGLLYVAGSVVLDTAAGRKPASVETASDRDARYDEASGGITRPDLPLDFEPAAAPSAAGSLDVNLKGALYSDGEIRLPGGPRVYGVLAAERGVRDAGSAEVWYDPSWMTSQVSLCSECCGLSLSPVAPKIALGDTLQLTANRPQGQVVWESLAPGVVTVDDTGLATAQAEGIAVVRATDVAGCVAEAEVQVFCGLTLEPQGSTDLAVGDSVTVVGSGQRPVGGGITWSVDNPSSVGIANNFVTSVRLETLAIGGARLTGSDGMGCTAGLDFTVNCPAGRVLSAEPAQPAPGEPVTLAVRDPTSDVSSLYEFFAGGTALPGPSFTPDTAAPVTLEARLLDGTCPLTPFTLTPACPAFRIVASPATAPVGEPIQLSVVDASGGDATADFSFQVAPADAASLSGATLVLQAGDPVTVTAADAHDCPATSLNLAAAPPP